MFLKRFESPASWEHLAEEFGRFPGQLRDIYWESLEYMIEFRSDLVLTWKSDLLKSHPNVYEENNAEKAHLKNFLAFMD